MIGAWAVPAFGCAAGAAACERRFDVADHPAGVVPRCGRPATWLISGTACCPGWARMPRCARIPPPVPPSRPWPGAP